MFMKYNIKKIALVRLSALGDIVHSAIVLQFIKQHYPDAQVEWITEKVFAPILEDAYDLDVIHTVDIKQIKKTKNFSLLRDTIAHLQNLGEFDLIIDMQGLIKSAIVARLVGKNTHGFDADSTRESLASFFYKTTSTISYETSVVKRNAFVVADPLGFEISDAMILDKKPLFQVRHKFELSKGKNVACVIGASWKSKIYPVEHVICVCASLDATCHIIWGNDEEFIMAQEIVAKTTNTQLAPKMSLSELVSFITQCDLVIGNDTGPTHIAWAQNVPSIVLFGPTNERMIFQTPYTKALHSPSHVDILSINKEDYSLKELPPQTVIQHAKELLDYGI